MTQSNDNRALEDAMRVVAAEDSPEARHQLYAAMAFTRFLVPVEAAGELAAEEISSFRLGKPVKGPETQPLAITVCIAGDQQVAPVFTHVDALKSWDEKVPWTVLTGADMFAVVLAAGADEVAINPFEPEKKIGLVRPGGRVTHWEIEMLAEGRSPESEITVDTPQQVLLSTPSQKPPQEFFAALIEAAKKLPVVREMYFCQMSNPQGESRKSIAVEFSPEASKKARDSAIAAFSDVLEPMLGEEEVVDFFGTATEMGEAIAKTGDRFYGG
ncbi:MAG: enhanced serine sensitivity protein SseB [Acidobacteriia bacterium]|nr:enhanced serine sensitivity protein SseB [Terriglobia bacterium]